MEPVLDRFFWGGGRLLYHAASHQIRFRLGWIRAGCIYNPAAGFPPDVNDRQRRIKGPRIGPSIVTGTAAGVQRRLGVPEWGARRGSLGKERRAVTGAA